MRFFQKYLFCLIAAGTLLLPGCGGTTTTSTFYDSPNWMPDGRIISAKYVIREATGLWGRYTAYSKNFIAAISSDGTNSKRLR